MGRYCFADQLYIFQNFRGVHITWILTYKNILAVEFNHFYVPPFSKAGHIALLLSVCLFVGWSVSRFTNSFRSFYLQRLHVFKWYLVYRFIIIRSRSNLYVIKSFLTELWCLDIKNFQLYAVSLHFLCRGCML